MLARIHDGRGWCVLLNKRSLDASFFSELDQLMWQALEGVTSATLTFLIAIREASSDTFAKHLTMHLFRRVFIIVVLLADTYYFSFWLYAATKFEEHTEAASYFYRHLLFPLSGGLLDLVLFLLTALSLFLLNFQLPFNYIPPANEVVRFWISAMHGIILFAFLWSHM